MKDSWRKKGLVVSVILLFIGVSIAPSINFTVVKASNDNDFIEVTTQACGIKGYGNTTVKLTREQYNDLEQYLVEFRTRLNQTTTKEEAVPLFKEAVLELNKYGLLPRGMSVEQAQRVVLGDNQQSSINRISNNEQIRSLFPNYINVFCLLCAILIPGENPDWESFGGLFLFTLLLSYILFPYSRIAFGLVLITLVIGWLSPLELMSLLIFTGFDILMISLGLNGLVIDRRNNLVSLGFTGLLLESGNGNCFLLGFSFALDNTTKTIC